MGIFTHHTDFRDVKEVEREQIHDEVVSRLVVERGHRRLELLRADTERRFRCCVIVLAEGRAVGSPQRVFAAATSGDVSLPERERNHKGRQEQKHVKRASKEMRFSRTVDALFHCHCVPGEQPVLLEARQRCRDSSCKKAHHSFNSPLFSRVSITLAAAS